jgi:hypothetical protein
MERSLALMLKHDTHTRRASAIQRIVIFEDILWTIRVHGTSTDSGVHAAVAIAAVDL